MSFKHRLTKKMDENTKKRKRDKWIQERRDIPFYQEGALSPLELACLTILEREPTPRIDPTFLSETLEMLLTGKSLNEYDAQDVVKMFESICYFHRKEREIMPKKFMESVFIVMKHVFCMIGRLGQRLGYKEWLTLEPHRKYVKRQLALQD